MFCPFCGTQLPEGAAFCPSCGSPVGNQQAMNQQQMMNQQQVPNQQVSQQQVNYPDAQPTMNQQQMNQQQMMNQQQVPNQQVSQQQVNYPDAQPTMNQQQMNQQQMPAYDQFQNYSAQPAPAPDRSGKSKKKKVLIIVIALLIAAAGGLTAYFLLRDKKGGGSADPKSATEKCIDAMQSDDIEQIIKLIPDDVVNLYISLNPDDYHMIDVYNADDWNEMLRKIYKENGNHVPDNLIPDHQIKVNDYIEGTLEKILDELTKSGLESDMVEVILKEMISSLGIEDRFALIDITITENGESHSSKDLCYKYKGDWYSFSALSIPDALFRYIKAGLRSKDVAAAQTIGTALQTALADEDCYDELSKHFDGRVLFTAKSGEEFKPVEGVNAPNACRELNMNLGGSAPNIKFTEYGQTEWAVGIDSNGKAVVWIANQADQAAYELYPDVSDLYK